MPLVHAIDPPAKANVGELMRESRVRRRMTQAQLAEAVGVTSRTVGAWERGESEPAAGFLPLIGQALGVRFVDDGAGNYSVLDSVPDVSPDVPRVVVIVVASADEAVDVVRRIQQGLDPQG